jgi:hypothetical protein
MRLANVNRPTACAALRRSGGDVARAALELRAVATGDPVASYGRRGCASSPPEDARSLAHEPPVRVEVTEPSSGLRVVVEVPAVASSPASLAASRVTARWRALGIPHAPGHVRARVLGDTVGGNAPRR